MQISIRLFLFILFIFNSIVANTQEVVINMSNSQDTIRHTGSGFLFGFSAKEPQAMYFESIKPKLLRFRAVIDGPNTGWMWDYNLSESGYTGIFSDEMMERLQRMNIRQQIVVNDSYGERGYSFESSPNYIGWPGDMPMNGIDPNDKLLEIVEKQVKHILEKGYKNIEWDIWNEPDWQEFWPTNRFPEQYYATWKLVYDFIRKLDPTATIVGPSYAFFSPFGKEDGATIKEFLQFAQANNCLPDRLTWHELGNDGHRKMANNVEIMRRFMKEQMNISPLPIDINEIVSPENSYSPGVHVWNFAEIEKSGVEGVCHAVWNEIEGDYASSGLMAGYLCHLLTQQEPRFQPRSVWHVYDQYARMEGVRMGLTPSKFINGLSVYDTSKKQLKVLLGNDANYASSSSLVLEKCIIGENVKVSSVRVPNEGKSALLTLPTAENLTHTVSNGDIQIPITLGAHEALLLIIEDVQPDNNYLSRFRKNNLLPYASMMENLSEKIFDVVPNAQTELDYIDKVEGNSSLRIKQLSPIEQVVLSSSSFKVGKNREYIISFATKSIKDARIDVQMFNGKTMWANGSKTVNSTPEWTRYELIFKSPPTTMASTISTIKFNLLGDFGSANIDDVTITERRYEDYPNTIPPLAEGLSTQLRNGSFADGATTSWTSNSSISVVARSGMVDDGWMLKVDIDDVDIVNPFYKSFFQDQIFLQSNKEYLLSFSSKADKERSLYVSIPNIEEEIKDMVLLFPEWHYYRLPIAVNKTAFYSLHFGFASHNASFYMDDIVLTNQTDSTDLPTLINAGIDHLHSSIINCSNGVINLQPIQSGQHKILLMNALGNIVLVRDEVLQEGMLYRIPINMQGIFLIELIQPNHKSVIQKIIVS